MSPLAPVIEKGALIIMDQSSGSEKNKIIFNYNPETLKRAVGRNSALGSGKDNP